MTGVKKKFFPFYCTTFFSSYIAGLDFWLCAMVLTSALLIKIILRNRYSELEKKDQSSSERFKVKRMKRQVKEGKNWEVLSLDIGTSKGGGYQSRFVPSAPPPTLPLPKGLGVSPPFLFRESVEEENHTCLVLLEPSLSLFPSWEKNLIPSSPKVFYIFSFPLLSYTRKRF